MLIPGKLYKFVISGQLIDKYGYDIGTYLDNIPVGNYGLLYTGDILLYCKEVWVPDVKLYQFIFFDKIIYYSSCYNKCIPKLFISV
jgi:hypothetical protein